MFQLLPLIALLISLQTVCAIPLRDYNHDNDQTPTMHTYQVSSESVDPVTDFPHSADEPILHELDEALTKLPNVYMQALFSGTHTSELEVELDALEMRLFDLLDSLYKENRMAEYMKYEAEVTHKMIVYNLLKKLFGYAKEE
ncbi:uncharacterized protein LOC129245308 [Anastrepha obliqua]|uniref:uncharacterized protein LOC128866767 n=1 Tax=Anastrepha ludens TaxID=28586 RepID=UPI0023AF0893|nr:uncharacterized protein LOC128866767 [Anastrepha ludens]XP_054739368.1 uncharacterized protein LOC129245308 [Anastrepha obliqua]